MKHTKEPWHVMEKGFGVNNGNANPIVYANDDKLRYVCKCADWLNIITTDNLANAQRIVKCINACAGITDEALDAGVVRGCIEVARIVNNPNVRKDSDLRWMGFQVFEEDV